MADNKTVKSSRERYSERLKAKYPDREYADDEAIFSQINDDYDDYDRRLSEYQEHEKAFSDLFTSNPRSAAFLTDWRKGEDPIIGMVRKFGDDFKEALEDPEKQEALALANKEYAEKIAEERKYEQEYKKNITATLETLEAVQKQDGLSDEDLDKAMDFLLGIMRDGLLGKFSAESVRMAVKALRHDNDVEDASREGEVRGRNARIEEKLRKTGKTDGTANLAGSNGGRQQKGMPDMGALDSGYGKDDIWKRGGMKRTKRG